MYLLDQYFLLLIREMYRDKFFHIIVHLYVCHIILCPLLYYLLISLHIWWKMDSHDNVVSLLRDIECWFLPKWDNLICLTDCTWFFFLQKKTNKRILSIMIQFHFLFNFLFLFFCFILITLPISKNSCFIRCYKTIMYNLYTKKLILFIVYTINK